MAGNILMYFSLKDEEMKQSLVIMSYYVETLCLLLELLSLIIHQSYLLGRVGFDVQKWYPEWWLSPLLSDFFFTLHLGKAVNSPAVATDVQPEMSVLVRLPT